MTPADDRQAPASPPDQDVAVKSFIFAATFLVTVLLATLVAQLPIGGKPPWLMKRTAAMTVLWPQGWSFFSDAATADIVGAYKRDPNSGSLRLLNYLQVSDSNRWGLSRLGLAQTVELQDVANAVPSPRWRPCNDQLVICLQQDAIPVSLAISDRAPHPTLCGTTIITHERPILWVGRGRPQNPRLVILFAEVDVECPRR